MSLVLNSDATDVKTLQRPSVKCISFSLAIPGTRLFLNEIYNIIGKRLRHGSSKLIPVSGLLRQELQQWLFLESWSGCLPWRQEIHRQMKLCSDASSFAWGCVLGPDTIAAVIRDFWPVDQRDLHINVKEALALANALDAFSSSLRDSWVDVYTDSQVLITSWRRQGTKSRDLACVFNESLGLFPVVTSISTSFTFLLLIIQQTLVPVFYLYRMLSFLLWPGIRFRPNLVANLATPRI